MYKCSGPVLYLLCQNVGDRASNVCFTNPPGILMHAQLGEALDSEDKM